MNVMTVKTFLDTNSMNMNTANKIFAAGHRGMVSPCRSGAPMRIPMKIGITETVLISAYLKLKRKGLVPTSTR